MKIPVDDDKDDGQASHSTCFPSPRVARQPKLPSHLELHRPVGDPPTPRAAMTNRDTATPTASFLSFSFQFSSFFYQSRDANPPGKKIVSLRLEL